MSIKPKLELCGIQLYHRKLFRGKYVYMAHAKNAMVQEIVASALQDYKIPMVPWGIYNAAKEMGGMESGLKAFKETMAKIVGALLSSSDRRSPGRRYWDAHKDILKYIADEEYMSENGLTGWAAATLEHHEGCQQAHTDAKANKCVRERGGASESIAERGTWWISWATCKCRNGVTATRRQWRRMRLSCDTSWDTTCNIG
jgi:hypothetical protein